MTTSAIEIGGTQIGNSHPPFVVAEAGVHHNNSLKLAKQYVRTAAAAGADAIKFQTYSADRLAARWAPTYWDSGDDSTQFDIFSKRSLLAREDYIELFRHAQDHGILFLSTPFDPDSALMLYELGMAVFKIASADLTNYPLLRTVAEFGLPVLLSTGASTFDEIQSTLDMLSAYPNSVSLLHCCLSYPTAIADANLKRISELERRFSGHVIGYSDHTQPQDSELACPIAVGLGARVVEKHYTLDKSLPGDDHYHAVDQQGLARLVKNCVDAYVMTTEFQEVTETEVPARSYARRSIVAARDIPEATVLSADDVDCKRPGTGLSPTRLDEVIGRRTRRGFRADELIDLSSLE